MKIGKPKLILDPYEWLPGYGESKVSFRSAGPDVILDIEYEKEIVVDSEEIVRVLKREVEFRSVRCFIREPFPGDAIFEFNGDPNEFRLGQLTEFIDSEWLRNNLKAWWSVSSHEPPKTGFWAETGSAFASEISSDTAQKAINKAGAK